MAMLLVEPKAREPGDRLPNPTEHGGSSAGPRPLVIAWSAALLVYVCVIGLTDISDGTARLINNVSWTVAATLAAVSSFRASSSLNGRERTAWLIFGFACTAWVAGQLVWNVYEFYFGVVTPFPSYADVGYLAYGPLMVLGLFALRATQQERRLTWLRAANLGLILCSLAVVLITTFRQPFIQTNQQLSTSLIVVGENASISVAFILALYFLWSYRWGNRLLAYTLIMLSLATQMISGLMYTRGLVVADYGATNLFNVGWILGFALHQWAAETQVSACARVGEDVARLERAQGWVEALVPSFLLLCIVITAALVATELTATTIYLRNIVLALFAAILALREAWLYSHGKQLRAALDSSARELTLAREQLDEMHEQRVQLERVIDITADAGGVGLWEWDPTSGAVRFSAECKRQLGFAEHELPDELRGWQDRLHPADRARVINDLDAFIRNPGKELVNEVRLLHRDGTYRWILTRGSVLYDSAGRIDRMYGSHVDITPFKELEQSLRDSEGRYRELAEALETRVSQRTRELTEAYRESRSFAYAVAHDLKAPLRAINGFCALLDQSAGDRLTAVERSYIERASQGAMRMAALIEDLLNYSRVEHREQRFDAIDCKRFVDRVLASMTEAIQEAGATITVKLDSTPVLADSEGLRIALTNLLENALKFSRETEQPRIDIESSLEAGRYLLKVRDNGIGFDPAYHDNIFQIFNRLHASGYEGTGIGLALVRKAVQRMGGEVWAEGVPGQGATFFVSLSLAQSAAPEHEPGSQRVGTH